MNISGITTTQTLSDYAYEKRRDYRREETPDFLQTIEEKGKDTAAGKGL